MDRLQRSRLFDDHPPSYTLILFITLLLVLHSYLVSSLQTKSSVDLEIGVQIHDDLFPHVVFASKGQSITLNCSASSSVGSFEVSWRHDKEDISLSDTRRVTNNDGSLTIKKFSGLKKLKGGSVKTDEGKYFCVVKSSTFTVLSRPINVIANRTPTLVVEPSNVLTKQGSNVRFECQVSPRLYEVTKVEWFLNNRAIDNHTKMKAFSNILQLVDVSFKDEGTYSCSGLIDSNVIRSQPAQLSVEPGESIVDIDILSPETLFVRDTKVPIVLECFPKKFSPTAIFNWTRLPGYSLPKSHYIEKEFGNLIIPTPTSDVEGDYNCSFDTGSNNITHKVQVLIPKPPIIKKLPHSAVHPSSQTVRLDCSATGVPLPTLHWFKDGKSLLSSGRFTIKPDMLVISQTTGGDSGIYQCLAENEEGSATAYARLVISTSSEQPKPPTDLIAKATSSSSIYLQWTSSESPSGLPVLAYTVNYRTADNGGEQRLTSTKTNFLVENLVPFTRYIFYVRAFNNKGAGEPSMTIEATTLEAKPIAAPHFQTRVLSPTQLSISWKPLPSHYANGEIISYEIQYKKQAQDNYYFEQVPSTQRQHILKGLSPETIYDIRVLAGTRVGFPNVSDVSRWPWTSCRMPSREQMHLITSSNSSEVSLIEATSSHIYNFNFTTEIPDSEEEDELESLVPSESHSKTSWWIWTLTAFGIVVASLVLCVIILVFHRSQRRTTTIHMNGHVPRAVYVDTTIENREMESFLNEGNPTTVGEKNGYVTLNETNRTVNVIPT